MKSRPSLRRRVVPTVSRRAHEDDIWLEAEKPLRDLYEKGRLTREALPTPALLLDLEAFEYNVRRAAEHTRSRGLSLRPHGKSHKCPEIAKRLIGAGAVGCCAAKLSEAEVFAREGVSGLLITTAVIGKHKIERLARLAKARPDTMFSVDEPQNVRDLNDAARLHGIRINLAIDLRIGHRTGVEPGKPAFALAHLIQSLPHVRFAGLQAYASHASHVAGWEKRRRVSLDAMGQAVATRELLEQKGFEVPFLSGGSTGTYDIDSEIDGVTELQPGSFIFMDVSYNAIGRRTGPVFDTFRNALSVLTTVVSKPSRDVAVVDGGFKAFATDQPALPIAKDQTRIHYSWGGDEHGILHYGRGSKSAEVGDAIEFWVPHCDPTVNLYDRIFCLRGDRVEAVWQIAARGMSQ
jgi:3-hydroxy-D-aspartate aldolase